MRINHNIAALNTYRQLNTASTNQSKSMEKLASGLRINKAGDDAAGLAISEKMRAQVRGLDQAGKNAQDGISLIQTAEGALNETHDILQRMRELATQAANDTNTKDDRGEIQKEINQLTSEINRIGNTTEFNTRKLLNGERSDTYQVSGPKTTAAETVKVLKAVDQTISVGDEPVSWSDSDSKVDVDLSFSATPAANGFDWAALDTGETNELSIEKSSGGFTLTFAGKDTGGNTLAIDAEALAYDAVNDTYSFDNHGISFSFKGADVANWAEGETVTIDLNKVDGGSGDVTGGVNTLPVAQEWTTDDSNLSAAAMTNFKVDGDAAELLANVAKVNVQWTAAGDELTVDLQDADGVSISSSTLSWDGTSAISYSANGISFDLDAGDATELDGTFSLKTDTKTITTKAESTTDAVIEDRSLSFQIGANAGQSMNVSISDMRATALNISSTTSGANKAVTDGQGNPVTASYVSTDKDVTDGTNSTGQEYALDISDSQKATAAVAVLDEAIAKVSGERSKLGSYQNRLEHTINNLNTSSENLTAAESRIRDVDMAKEMMNQTKNSILSQAAQAMLAQSNQMPQGVLQLLR